ncbi:MAG: dephospho-CoA kinase [Candidatus Omnitrophica bacterium]|nr:dephospho-CoA kinase [Candidatus Omnitrophota bacterium]
MTKRIVIGVTGGLASGKTVVANLFKELGAAKIDADEIAHDLLANDENVRTGIVDLFGESILGSKGVDRRKLASVVFFDKQKLRALCGVLHPKILKRIKSEADEVEESIVVVDAPLLFETHLEEYVDVSIIVNATREIQIERAMARGIPEKEASNIIENQMPFLEKERLADYVIDNKSDRVTIRKGVEEIWRKLKKT